MSVNKPSDAEQEFFKKSDLERVQRMRTRLDQQRDAVKAEQQRQEHWMRCPKCGGEMEEVLFRHIMVDRCTACGYVGFDAGELEILLGEHADEPFLSRFGHELRRMFAIGGLDKDQGR